MIVIITEEEKELLAGKMLSNSTAFNPVINADGGWCITEEEISANQFSEYDWLKDRELVEFTPPVMVPSGEIEIEQS